jgi:hypothetical protein
MPSVFTIDGTDVKPKPAKRAKRTRKALGDAPPNLGDCRTVKNPRTGCSMQLCYVGIGAPTRNGKKSRTGWEFQEGSSSCPTRRR